MKRFALVMVFLGLALSSTAADHDVNRDGRIDQADVAALARMVAGLDPVDLRYDFDGNGVLTLDDVEILVDATAAPPTPTPAPAATRHANSAAGSLSFYALQRKADGECVVVAGAEGIAPGDTVLGVSPTFPEAQGTAQTACGTAAPGPGPATSPQVPPSTTHGTEIKANGPTILAVPIFDSDDTTRGMLVVDGGSGRTTVIDRARRTSAEVRERPFRDNLFNAVDRPFDRSARAGHLLTGPVRSKNGAVNAVLVVDTTTGAAGYIHGLKDDPTRGRIRKVSNRPVESIAEPDGNFTMVMRRDRSGETVGAYVIHGPSGRGLYLRDIDDLPTSLTVSPVSGLPKTTGAVSGMAVQSDSEATARILLVDQLQGTLHLIEGLQKRAGQVTSRALPTNVVSTFPTDGSVAAAIRFVTVPITTDSGSTDSALILDVASGGMALLEHLRKPSKIRLIGVNRSMYGLLPVQVDGPRSIAAVPKIDESGATVGAWIFDSASDNAVFLANLDQPHSIELRPVTTFSER